MTKLTSGNLRKNFRVPCFPFTKYLRLRNPVGEANLQLELISLVIKVSFTCKFFSFFQNDRDNGESTVGLLVLT